ncbi:hypothetical protein ACFL54_09475, partial [Planctomycetota bacterium]
FADNINELRYAGANYLPEGLERACVDTQDVPKAFEGYLFTIIDMDDSGQSGLCAYPEKPGKTGDTILLVFIDGYFAENPVFTNKRDTLYIYQASYKDIGRPINEAPSAQELSKFEKVEKKICLALAEAIKHG